MFSPMLDYFRPRLNITFGGFISIVFRFYCVKIQPDRQSLAHNLKYISQPKQDCNKLFQLFQYVISIWIQKINSSNPLNAL